ncbi:Tryptophan--tRNA ligase [Rickettsiales endosymbiont of Paramecium tredecaurelia]|uniref:tryptophan--tRNA ligase n=1 Tax=Candidatus Sarmatiella mevalonica TaxID=2770581 RepID=UPI0019244DB7|nr:tryptophan--tRNA ligase [Candidatus Sarmatiella mevalonica]MBL3284465.1 Tryptophan--tRNA ligase [Candidatus Sarmatiella mevalonica]
MKHKLILTGDRPTGALHLGHYVGSLASRVKLQEQYQQYIMLADVQALTDNFQNPQKVIDNVYEVAKDYLAVGIDPNKSTIFIQSQIPEIAELTMYYLNLVTLARLRRNPTVKTEMAQKSFEAQTIPMGFLCYPINQAADITIFQANLVPVGEDQLPMLEQTNEIVRSFNRIYDTSCLVECEAYLSENTRLVGIDGKNKASKSLNNAIFLSDDEAQIKSKVFAMFTDPNHIKITDPGNVEGNVVFAYLDAFHENKEEVAELKTHYSKGGLGDVTIKNILNQTLQQFIAPIRERKKKIHIDDVKQMLHNGGAQAAIRAKATIAQVRSGIGINYFE